MGAMLDWTSTPRFRLSETFGVPPSGGPFDLAALRRNSKPNVMPIIEINNLTKDYEVGFWRKRKVRALDGLSLTVEPHQIFGFLGANGAGKTTTLKLLMRLIFPTSG